MFNRRGSAEIAAVVLLVVVLGGLALGVGATLSKQTSSNANKGMTTTTQQLQSEYNKVKNQIQ